MRTDYRLLIQRMIASSGLAITVVACGGGAGDPVEPPPPPPPPPPPAITVSVSPAATTVDAGGTQGFTAAIDNATNTALAWTSTGGTIAGSGLSATWTAPIGGGEYTIRATSVQDPTKSGTATVTVTPVSVSIDPQATTIEATTNRAFTATIANTALKDVIWTATGGTLETTTGSTVNWTAPAIAGSYTVTATSAADNTRSASSAVTVVPLSPIDVVVDQVAMGQGGGTVRVTKAASPLRGLTISVPTGAYPGATTWSVAEMREVRPVLPGRVRQVGPTIRIGNGQAVAAIPFTMAIPIRVAADSGVAAFLRDPASGTLELLPVVARTDTSLIVITRHVNGAEMALPQTASLRARSTVWSRAKAAIASLAAGSSASAAGEVEIITVAAQLVDLLAEIRGDYRPGIDDWEFANRGSFLTPGGYCAGSTISSLYYSYARRATQGSLFGRYDEMDSFESDNARGIRLASVVQRKVRWDEVLGQLIAGTVQSAAASAGGTAGGSGWATLQAQTLALAMLTTGRAQLLGIYRPGWQDGHSIVTQGVVQGSIFVSDPNEPGVERTLAFDATGFTPFPFSANADLPSDIYTDVFVMGMSAMVPVADLRGAWDQFDAETIGDVEFPTIYAEYRDPVNDRWRPVSGELRTASTSLIVRTRCSNCPTLRAPPANPADRVLTLLIDDMGKQIAADPEDTDEGATATVATGTSRIAIRHDAYPVGGNGYPFFVDFSWLNVNRVPFQLLRSRFQAIVGQEVTWSVNNGGLGGPGSTYRWKFGSQAPVVTPLNVTSVTHRFTTRGVNNVSVELLDAEGVVLAKATGTFNAAEGYHWRMECAEVKADNPHAGWSGAQASAYNRWITGTSRLPTVPQDGFLSLLTPTTSRQFGSFFTVTQPGQGATAKALPLFPLDSLDSPKLEMRVYTGSVFEAPGGPPGYSLQYRGGVLDNIFGAQMVTDVELRVHSQGWGRGVVYAWISGFGPKVRIRFYARQIWEANPAPTPPCLFGNDWP